MNTQNKILSTPTTHSNLKISTHKNSTILSHTVKFCGSQIELEDLEKHRLKQIYFLFLVNQYIKEHYSNNNNKRYFRVCFDNHALTRHCDDHDISINVQIGPVSSCKADHTVLTDIWQTNNPTHHSKHLIIYPEEYISEFDSFLKKYIQLSLTQTHKDMLGKNPDPEFLNYLQTHNVFAADKKNTSFKRRLSDTLRSISARHKQLENMFQTITEETESFSRASSDSTDSGFSSADNSTPHTPTDTKKTPKMQIKSGDSLARFLKSHTKNTLV